ncbi:TIGR03016 family PEP-CTERM system-associated outer membrane protein [Massilia putida]|uniref:TIGR03016 family PEP-CTERM system-associated outer membrane protein n=1 Tax=Massilia putida TaxID=1141883 RepID=UPI000952C3EE|nr:TIGR03016 family PEP-CTERM system-associated outer membrane protein [Massilia putida]
MTITTANWAALRLTPLALAALLLANDCRAEWKVTPTIQLRESYSDNAGNQPDEQARGSFISEAAPNLVISGTGSRLKFNASAEWHKYVYSNDDMPNVRNSDRSYQASAQAVAVKELLYVDATASGSRQAVSAFGPVPNNSYTANNSADIRTWSISPYLRHRFGSTATMTARLSRDSVESGSNSGFGNSLASTRAFDVTSGPAFPDLGWNVHYSHQDMNAQLTGNTTTENSLAGLQYRLTPHLSVTSSVGYDKYQYRALAERTRGRSWSGGFIWQPSSRTRVSATYGRRYFGKTGSFDGSYRTQHSIWSLTYADIVTTTRSQFLIPAALDTAAMLDRLFAGAYPDPVLRQQIVQAYMAQTGLPPTLANSINYLSNRYMRNKRLQGSVTFKGARSALLLSVFKDRTNALSLQQEDSTLLPTQLSSLNEDTSQRGASANFDYRLSTRTSAHANLYGANVKSLRTGLTNDIRQLSAGLSSRFDTKTTGSLDLRHSKGRVGVFDNRDYHENAIVATLTVQY